MDPIPVGKLPAELLQSLLDRYVPSDPRVIVGPGIGQDAAVIDMGDRYLVAKTDPITFATDQIGWYAVNINANDVACCGARPRWFLATLLLPDGQTTAELAESIFGQLSEACRQLGVALCGGHTEIAYDLSRPIVVGQMLGEVAPDRYLTTAGARVGDVLILTKGIAVEGTAIMAREKRPELGDVLSAGELDRCARLLREPGISVVREAQLAQEAGGVHALHDPTEGGLATGLWELAQAAGVGVVLDRDRVPLLEACQRLCDHLGLDPLGLIASGALLIAAEAECGPTIIKRLESAGVTAAIIGRVVPPEEGCQMRLADGSLQPLPRFPRDEITRLFG
ncbi:MAG TPA: hydrogenase expression/formation protein [Planctomycetes bacterium]|nr:hydrogenase expression/formation protein [Planctomycetota bacterium]